MTAAVLNQTTCQMEVHEVAQPKAGTGEVLIKLKAASLNHHELWSMKERSISAPFPVIMGSDGAGEVVKAGEGVGAQWIGKQVVINPSLYWGNNPAFTGPDYEILGFPTNGTFAEFINISTEYVHEKPSHLSFEEAAALPLAGLTAYRALFTKGQVQKGEKVLITGIGGGAALFALQFAVASGAAVYVTSGSNQKIEAAVQLGAKGGANYKSPDWGEKLREMAGEFNVIIDSAAGGGFPALTDLAAFGGRIILFGRTAGNIPQLKPRTIFWKQLSVLGTTMGNPGEFKAMLRLVIRHKIRPVVDTIFPLAQINEAFRKMEEGQQLGKIVLSMENL